MRCRTRQFGALLLVIAAVCMSGLGPAVAASGDSHNAISASGSSWAAIAVQAWKQDVSTQGISINWNASGSATGRSQFANNVVDFGVSDIAFQGTDPKTQQNDNSNGRQFAYLPIVAGGTAFPYHIGNGARQIRNLRLSQQTLAEIFTDQIQYWDDPRIEADNNNDLKLPHLRVVPVVHSEGSGSTAQFTLFLSKQLPQLWAPFNYGQNAMVEYFPAQSRNGVQQISQNGSDQVINFVNSQAGNGTIAFDEYSYALNANLPVADIENAAGYFTAPTQYAVAVALTQAKIDFTDVNDPNKYLTQDLDNVYEYTDPRTYPLSSYSYAIIPIGANSGTPPAGYHNETKTTKTGARQSIADYLYWSICQGQAEIGPLGYSALTLNLVQDGFNQIAKLKTADPGVDLTNRNVTTCNNPTFVPGNLAENRLAQIAPQPAPCDHVGQGPCAVGVGLQNGNPDPQGNVPAQTGQSGPAGAGGPSVGNAGGGGGNGSVPRAGTGPAATAGRVSVTGPHAAGARATRAAAEAQAAAVAANASESGSSHPDALAADTRSTRLDGVLAVLAGALVLVVLVGPALLARTLSGQ